MKQHQKILKYRQKQTPCHQIVNTPVTEIWPALLVISWNFKRVMDCPSALAGPREAESELFSIFSNSFNLSSGDKTWRNNSTSEVKHAKCPNLSPRTNKGTASLTIMAYVFRKVKAQTSTTLAKVIQWYVINKACNIRNMGNIRVKQTGTHINTSLWMSLSNQRIIWYLEKYRIRYSIKRIIPYLEKYSIRYSINLLESPFPRRSFFLSISRSARYGHLM